MPSTTGSCRACRWKCLIVGDSANDRIFRLYLQGGGPDAPAGRSPFQARFRAALIDEGDYLAVERAASLGTPIRLWPGWWQVDVWAVPVGGAGRTSWRTSRRLPFEVDGYVAGMGLDPVAELDGVALSVVNQAPGAGEIRLPATNDGPNSHIAILQTPPLDSASELLLRYPAEYSVIVSELKRSVPIANRLVLEVEVIEHLPARFTDF